MERHTLRRFYGRQILRGALFASTALVMPLVAPRPALAQIAPNTTPQGGVVVGGSAAIAQAPGSTVINQGSQRAAINWQSFDVGANAKVQFNQPNPSAIALNRVTGGNLSQINGQINANGQIVLINQSGVVFGKGSQVNAESVVVSTSDIAPGDFMAGKMNFTGAPKPGAQIINNGQITARDAGLVGLVAPQVANNGLITATLGRVVLAGASAFTLDLYGDRLISLDVTQAVRSVDVNGQLVPALVTNNGAILADGGKITLTAQDADALVTQLISAGGIVRADSVGAQTGTISVTGVGGNIQIAGNLLAQGITPGSHGGDIQVLTDGTVSVAPGGNIDASGDAGGGLVAIGTDLTRAQTGPTDTLAPAAAAVEIAQGSTIRANATGLGNAGTVTLLSQDFTGFQGVISGQGGPLGGNGGLTEISSRGVINLGGTVLETALNGQSGEILLDPNELYVTVGGAANSVTGGGTVTFGGSGGGATPSLVDPSQLDSLSGVVILEAAKLISVANAIDMTNASVLSLVSGGSISVTASIFVDGSLDLDAAGSLFIGAELNANNILLASGNAGTDIDAGVSASMGDVVLGSSGTIFEGAAGSITAASLVSDGSIGGDATLGNAGNIITTLGSFTLGGNLTLADEGGLTVGGSVSAANISLSGASLTFESRLNATGLMVLSSTGTISQGAGAISAATLDVSTADGLVFLQSPNNSIANVFGSTTGTLALGDAENLDVISGLTGASVFINLGTGLKLTLDATHGTIDATAAGGVLSLIADTLSVPAVTGALTAAVGTIAIAPANANRTITVTDEANGAGLTLSSAFLTAIKNSADELLIGGGSFAGAIDLGQDSTDHISFSNMPISVVTSGAVTTNGEVDATTLAFDAANFIQSSGTLLLDRVEGTASGAITMGSAVNLIGTFGAVSTSGNILLADDEAAVFDGLITTSGVLKLQNSGGGYAETGNGTLDVGDLTTGAGAIAGNVTLGQVNAIGTLGEFNVTGAGNHFLLNDSGALTITNAVSVPGEFTLEDLTGGISESGIGAITAGTLSSGGTTIGGNVSLGGGNGVNTLGGFLVGALDSFYLDNSDDPLQVDGSVSGDFVTLTAEQISLSSGVNAFGSLELDSVTGLFQTGGSITVGTLGGDVTGTGDVSLTSATNNIGTLGNFTVAHGNLLLSDSGALGILGRVTTPDEFLLSVGSVGEIGSGAVKAGTLAATASGGITLGGTNTIANLGSILAGGDIFLADTGKLVVIDTVTGSDVTIAVPTLSLDSDIFATNATSATLALAMNTLLVTAGTFDVSTGGGTGTIFVAPYSANSAIDLNGSEVAALDLSPADIAAFDPAATEIVLGFAPVGTHATGISIDGSVSFAGTTLVDLSTTGAILDNAGTLSAATLAFDAAGFTQALAAALDLATLAGDGGMIGGSVTLPGSNNAIGEIANISLSGGALSLFDTAALTVEGLVTAPKIYLTDQPGITFAGSLVAASRGTIGLISDAFDTTATASTISAPSGTVDLSPFTGGAAIDFGGTGFTGLTLTDALLELIGAGLLSVGTQGGGTIYTENSVSLNVNELLFTGASIDLTGGTLALPGLLSFVSASDLSEADGVTLSVGGVAGTAAGNVFLGSGANTIGALGSISLGTAGTLDVVDSGTLTIAGAIDPAEVILFGSLGLDIATNVSATLLEIGSGGTIIQSGGSITAGTLVSDGSIGGDAYLTQAANAIGTLGAFTLGGSLDLIDTGSLDVAGPVFGANISLTAATMDLAGLVDAGTLIALGSTGTITQTGGTLIATDLSSIGTIGGDAALDGAANTIATLTGFHATGTLALDATGAPGPLTLAGTVQAGNATLDAAGLDFEGYITIGGLLDLASTAGASEASAGTITIGTLGSIGEITGGDVSLASGFNKIGTLGNVTLSGNLTLNDTVGLNIIGTVTTAGQILLTGAGLSEAGGALDAGTLTTGTGDETGNVLLTGSNNVVNLDAFTVTGGHTLALNDTGSLTIGGTVNAAVTTLSAASTIDIASDILATTELALGSAGTITQTAGTITTGTLVSDGSIGGDVALGTPFAAGVDSIASLGNFTLGGGLFLGDSQSLDETGIVRGTGLSSEILLEDSSTITIGGTLIAPIVALSAASSMDLAGVIDAPTRLALGGGSITQTGGSIVAGSLSSGGITGDVALNRAGNTIAEIGIFDADGAFSLVDTGSLAIIGPVTVGDFALSVPTLSLDADVNATAPGGTLALVSNFISVTAGTLGVDAGTIEIAPSASGYGIDLGGTAANALDVVGGIAGLFGGTPVEVIIGAAFGSTASFIDIDGSVSFGGTGVVDLATSGAIADNAGTLTASTLEFDASSFLQSAAAAIDTALLQGDGGLIGGNVRLAGTANSIATLGPLSLASGTLALTDADTLVIGGAVTASNIYLSDSNSGGIFIGDTLLAGSGGTIGLTSDALTSAASTATISAPGGVVALAPYTTADAIDIGGTGFAGLQLNNGLINLIGANTLRIGTAGGGTIYTEGSVSIAPSTLLLTGGSMDFTGTLAGPGLMSLAAAGSIAESPAAALIFGTIDGGAGAGADLGGRNSFGTIGDFAAGGDIVLRDLVSLAIDGTVSTSGSISLEGLAFQEFGTGQLDALELDSGATTIGGNVFLTGANTITDLGAFFVTQGATLALLDDRSLTVLGDVQADFISLSASTIDFDGFLTATTLLALASDFVTQTAGTIGAATLTSLGSIGGNVFLTDENAVTILSNFSVGAGDTLALTDATALTLGGTDIAPFASLTADGITFAGTFDAASLLLLGGAGAVTQTAGTIIAGTLATDGNIGGAITLLGPNLFGTLGGIAADGNIALNDAELEDIAGLVSTTGTITLEGTGNIDEIAGGTLAAAVLNSGGTAIGGDVFLTSANSVATMSDFSVAAGHTLAFADAGSLTLAGTIFAGFASLSGSFLEFAGSLDAVSLLDLASSGNVTQSSGTITTGTLVTANTIGGDVTLLDANTISTLGAFTLAALHTLSLRDAGLLTVGGPVFAPVATLSAASINLDGNIDGTALALESAGTVNQFAGTLGEMTLSSGGTEIGGNVTLGDANRIVTLANFDLASGSTLALTDARALTLGGSDFASFDSFSATSLDFEGFVTAVTLLQLASTGAVTQGSGTIQAGTLVSLGSINGNVGLTAANDIGTLGNFAVGAGDTLALTDATALTLAGAITAPFATFTAASLAISGSLDAAHLLALVSAGGIGETGSIVTGTLTSLGSLDGTTNLTASNTIGTLGIFAVGSGDSFALDDTGLLTVAGPLTGPIIDLFAGTIAIPGTITAGTLLALDAATSIAETGSLFAPTLTSGGATIGGGETLLGTNTIGTLGDIALGGNFALTNTGTLIIAGTLHTPGDVTFEDNAGITEAGGLIRSGTLDTGGTTLGGNLLLDGGNTIGNLGALTLGSGFTFNLADAGLLNIAGTVFAPSATLSAGSFAIAGALDGTLLALTSPGTIHETTGTIAVTTLTAIGTIGGDAYLTNSNVIGTLTNITMAAGTTLDLTDIEALVLAGSIIAPDAILSAPSLTFDGAFDAGNVLALTSVTSVTEGPDGAITAGTLTSLGSIDGDVFLTGDANTIGTVANFTVGSGDTFALDDTGLLNISGPLAGPNVTLFSPTITITGLIDATLLALESTGSITETVGTIFATTLTSGGTVIGGDLALLGSNTIGTLGDVSLAGNFALNNTGPLNIDGTLATPGTVTLTDNAGVFEALGQLDIGTLTTGAGSIGGTADFNGAANTIGNVGDFTLAAGQTLVLDDTGLLTVFGTVFAPVATFSTDTLAIGGALDGTSLALINDGTVTETGGTISVATLTGAGDGLVSLLDANSIGTLGAFAAGSLALKDGIDLAIDGLVSSASTITLEDAGSIAEITGGTLNAAVLNAGGTTIGGSVTLLNTNAIGTIGQFAAAQNIAFDDGQTYVIDGLVAAGGTLSLAGSGLAEIAGGTIDAAELLSIGSLSGGVTLNNANRLATLGGFIADDLFLNDATALTLDGQISLSGAAGLGLASAGGITQVSGDIIAAQLTSDGRTEGGNVVLNDANTISTLGGFSGIGNLALKDLHALTINGAVTLAGTLGIQDSGNVVQTGGSILAAQLTTDGGSIAGYALFNRQNSISSMQNFTAVGGLSLTDAVGLILAGAIDTGTADLRLADGGNNISQAARGVITTGLLAASAGNIWLGSSLNAIADLGQVTTGSLVVNGVSEVSGPIAASNASILSGGDMLVTGDVNIGGKLLLNSAGTLSQVSGTIAAGSEYLNAQFIYLGATNFAGTLIGVASQVIGQTAGLASASGVVLLQSNGGHAFQNAGGTLAGYDIVVNSSAGSVQVAGSIAARHDVTLSGKRVDDEAANLSAGSAYVSGQYGVTLNGNNAISGLLSVNAVDGKVAQYGGNLAAGTIDAVAGSTGIELNGNVAAQSATLAVNTLAAPAFGGGVQLDGNISIAGGLYLSSGDGIYQTGGVVRAGGITGVATFGAGDNINLSGGTMYDAGSLNLSAGGVIRLDDSRLVASLATLNSGIGITLGGTNDLTTGLFATTGTFSQFGGLIDAGTATISASSYLGVNGAVVIGGSLALTGGNALADNSTGLYAGSAFLSSPRGEVILNGNNSVANPLIVTAGTEIFQAAAQQDRIIAPAATMTAGGDIVLDGEGIFAGALDLLAGGDIFHDVGTQLLTAGTLEGRAAQHATFTAPTDFGTIGSFIMQDSVFSLVNSGTLAITGPLVANAISITAVGLVTLLGSPDGGLFISGLLEPKTVVTPQPGDSVITVTQGTNGATPLITQTGTFYINAGPEAAYFPAFANMPATLFMDMLPYGNIEFQPSPPAGDGLYGPSIELSVALGNSGTVSGNVDLQTILVISGTASNLTGLLDGVGGSAGASKGNVVPFPRPPFQFNACPIGSVNCIILPIESLPTANPLQNFDIEQRKRKSLNKNVTLPGVATRDF
jgi:filamentous hemagglutinin family protein